MVSNNRGVYVLDGVSLEYRVERRRVKNARIEVKPWGLLVILPLFGVNALSLLEKYKNWIVKVYRKLKERERLYNSPPDRFPIFGVEYNILVDENLNGFEIDENNRVIKLGSQLSPVALKNFFKTVLLNKILNFLENMPGAVDNGYHTIVIKPQKTRWASR
ncbi:MAG: YgjP-like metallopeptidase domain-containing protein, partial [Candidatus Odinarchaeota archaeon]